MMGDGHVHLRPCGATQRSPVGVFFRLKEQLPWKSKRKTYKKHS